MVIGAGIVGLSIARELKRRHPDARITLIEKEPGPGRHASGRNSGVLHAGFYYTADSLKARFCRDGNRALSEYIVSRGLHIRKCGKLVVARSDQDLGQFDELLRRAESNKVRLELVTEDAALRIEPRAKTLGKALWSPDTATADPTEVINAMQADATADGICITHNTSYCGRYDDGVITSGGRIPARFIVNCGGLYADKIAADFGFSKDYRILPFKGLYLYSEEPPGTFKTNIYPVPDLRNPFLGVHFTLTVDGHAKIGPTAIPAFWREQYSGLEGFDFGEFCEIAARDLGLIVFGGFDFSRLAFEEFKKYSKPYLVSLASRLATSISPDQFKHWGKPGIRAQLFDIRSRRLEMDFVIEGDSESIHVLNAVSPAWTCCLPFAEHVVDKIDKLQSPTVTSGGTAA